MPIERVLEVFGNRYVALTLASQEARRIIEAMNRGEIELRASPYYESLRRLVDNEIQFEVIGAKETTDEHR
jgi:hypothetical protein